MKVLLLLTCLALIYSATFKSNRINSEVQVGMFTWNKEMRSKSANVFFSMHMYFENKIAQQLVSCIRQSLGPSGITTSETLECMNKCCTIVYNGKIDYEAKASLVNQMDECLKSNQTITSLKCLESYIF